MVKAVSKKELECYWECNRPTMEETGMGGEGKTTKTENSGSSYGNIMCHAKKFELLFCAQEGTIKNFTQKNNRKNFQCKKSLSSADQQQIRARERETDWVIRLD